MNGRLRTSCTNLVNLAKEAPEELPSSSSFSQLSPTAASTISLAGEWTEETSGGRLCYGSWRDNPQYNIWLEATGKLVITLSQRALPRSTRPENLGRKPQPASADRSIGFYLLKRSSNTSEGDSDNCARRVLMFSAPNLIAVSEFSEGPVVCEAEVPRTTNWLPYVLLPVTHRPGHINSFNVTIRSNVPIRVEALDQGSAMWHTHSLNGAWIPNPHPLSAPSSTTASPVPSTSSLFSAGNKHSSTAANNKKSTSISSLTNVSMKKHSKRGSKKHNSSMWSLTSLLTPWRWLGWSWKGSGGRVENDENFSGTAGGCRHHVTWRNNPQFKLTITEPTTVVICLTQRPSNSSSSSSSYPASSPSSAIPLSSSTSLLSAPTMGAPKLHAIGLYVAVKQTATNDRKLILRSQDIVNKTLFEDKAEVCVELPLLEPRPFGYSIIPTTYGPEEGGEFSLRVWSAHPVDLHPVNETWKMKLAHGRWVSRQSQQNRQSGATSGGASFIWNNPALVPLSPRSPDPATNNPRVPMTPVHIHHSGSMRTVPTSASPHRPLSTIDPAVGSTLSKVASSEHLQLPSGFHDAKEAAPLRKNFSAHNFSTTQHGIPPTVDAPVSRAASMYMPVPEPDSAATTSSGGYLSSADGAGASAQGQPQQQQRVQSANSLKTLGQEHGERRRHGVVGVNAPEGSYTTLWGGTSTSSHNGSITVADKSALARRSVDLAVGIRDKGGIKGQERFNSNGVKAESNYPGTTVRRDRTLSMGASERDQYRSFFSFTLKSKHPLEVVVALIQRQENSNRYPSDFRGQIVDTELMLMGFQLFRIERRTQRSRQTLLSNSHAQFSLNQQQLRLQSQHGLTEREKTPFWLGNVDEEDEYEGDEDEDKWDSEDEEEHGEAPERGPNNTAQHLPGTEDVLEVREVTATEVLRTWEIATKLAIPAGEYLVVASSRIGAPFVDAEVEPEAEPDGHIVDSDDDEGDDNTRTNKDAKQHNKHAVRPRIYSQDGSLLTPGAPPPQRLMEEGVGALTLGVFRFDAPGAPTSEVQVQSWRLDQLSSSQKIVLHSLGRFNPPGGTFPPTNFAFTACSTTTTTTTTTAAAVSERVRQRTIAIAKRRSVATRRSILALVIAVLSFIACLVFMRRARVDDGLTRSWNAFKRRLFNLLQRPKVKVMLKL